jgi:hypothetical protein
MSSAFGVTLSSASRVRSVYRFPMPAWMASPAVAFDAQAGRLACTVLATPVKPHDRCAFP